MDDTGATNNCDISTAISEANAGDVDEPSCLMPDDERNGMC